MGTVVLVLDFKYLEPESHDLELTLVSYTQNNQTIGAKIISSTIKENAANAGQAIWKNPNTTASGTHIWSLYGLNSLDDQDHTLLVSGKLGFNVPGTGGPIEFDVDVAHGTVPTGIDKLITAAKLGKTLTPKSVLEGDEKAKLILMLADVYHKGMQSKRSLNLCNRILKGSVSKKATKAQKSYTYYRRGRNRYHITALTQVDTTKEERSKMHQETYQDYMAAQKIAPKEDWSVDAMYMAAIVLWNHGDKTTPQRKIQTADRSIAIHRRVVKTYPESHEAANSAYLVGVLYEWSKRYRDAKRVLEEVRVKYPSQISDADRHLKKIAELMVEKKSSKK